MNFLLMMIDGIVGFVKRNPIFCLVVLILALGAPSVLSGIAWVVLAVILGLAVLFAVMLLTLRWRIVNMSRQAGRNASSDGRREGDVSVHVDTSRSGKRVADNVGDYVEFEEEKNDDR